MKKINITAKGLNDPVLRTSSSGHLGEAYGAITLSLSKGDRLTMLRSGLPAAQIPPR